MNLRSFIDVVALFIGSVYGTIPLFWLLMHPFIARWRARGRRAYSLILPAWSALITVTFLLMWRYRAKHFYQHWSAWGVAAMFFLIGFSIYASAFKGFDRTQVSGMAELEPDRHHQDLATSGIRARVRHPIYLAHLCEILGWAIGTGLTALYALVAFAILTGIVMIRAEDRELETRFGDAYRAYHSAVPAVFPRLGQ